MDTDLFLSGCTLSLATYGSDLPIDFFVASPKLVVVALSDWWTIPNWGRGAGLFFLNGTVSPTAGGWTYIGSPAFGGLFGPPEDDWAVKQLANARLRCDVRHDDYLANLQELSDSLGTDFDISEWIAVWLKRPPVDAAAYALEQLTRVRSMATLKMFDNDGRTIGGLAVDEDGRAASSGISPWLAGMAQDYRNGSYADDLAEYINWAADRMPQGLYTLGAQQVSRMTGSVEDVADALLLPVSGVLGSPRYPNPSQGARMRENPLSGPANGIQK